MVILHTTKGRIGVKFFEGDFNPIKELSRAGWIGKMHHFNIKFAEHVDSIQEKLPIISAEI